MNIYVGNLSYSSRDNDLEQLFSAYGQVDAARVVMDRDTNRSKGFGFVEMSNKADGEKAIQALDGKEFQGRALKVNEAKPREKRPSRY